MPFPACDEAIDYYVGASARRVALCLNIVSVAPPTKLTLVGNDPMSLATKATGFSSLCGVLAAKIVDAGRAQFFSRDGKCYTQT